MLPDARPYPEIEPDVPLMPTVARLYTQGRYRRASVQAGPGQALVLLSDAQRTAGAWRQRAELRWKMIEELTQQRDAAVAALAAQPAPAPAASQIDVLKAMRVLDLSAEKLFRRIRDELREGHDAEARKMLDFVDQLVAASLPQGEDARAVIEQCREALAEELGAWDIDPPLHHVLTAHDACVRWLAASAPKGGEADHA